MSGAALYLRVSTPDQDASGQECELRDEATRRGWNVEAVYQERASATGRVLRDEYARLMHDAVEGERRWTELLVWSLDRFSRAAKFTDAVEAVWALEKAGVRFHSLKEPMLDTPQDGRSDLGREVLLALLPVIASFESRRRSERVRLALRQIRAGRRKTRSSRPLGRPVRMTWDKARLIAALRAEGLPWSRVAQRVGLPRETCRRALWLLKRRQGAVQKPEVGTNIPPQAETGCPAQNSG